MGRPFPKSHLLWQVNGAGMAWRGKVGRLDRELTQARKLLEETAALFKRGRYPRPLSNRITAFLEGPPVAKAWPVVEAP